jgi:hypothetical protein
MKSPLVRPEHAVGVAAGRLFDKHLTDTKNTRVVNEMQVFVN